MVTKSADAFRTISEVAEWLGVQTHVLRFWESKFSQVKPVKRAGGRRYYRPSDMLLLGGIRKLLHEDGMTIKGVQKILREEGMAHVADLSPPLDDVTAAQVDGDLVAGDGAVEIEMAPVDVAEAQDSPMEALAAPDAPAAEDAPAEPDAAPFPADPALEEADLATETDAEAPFPSDPSFDPDATPAADAEAVSVHAAPDPGPEPDRVEPETAFEPEPDPEPQPDASPVQVHFDPVTETDPLAATATDNIEDAAPLDKDEETTPTLPGFMRSPSSTPAPVAETAEQTAPASADPAPLDETGSDADATVPEPDAEAHVPRVLPSFMAPPEAEGDAGEAEATASPKVPRIIDVPDDPDPATLEDVKPGALGLAAQTASLTPAQRETIAPLVAQLTALRDRMAGARRDSR